MLTNPVQVQSNDAHLQHDRVIEQAAVETCLRSPNLDRLDSSVLTAKLRAAASANESMLPQTIFRTPNASGWWHTNCFSRLLNKAEVFATILPARYFQ